MRGRSKYLLAVFGVAITLLFFSTLVIAQSEETEVNFERGLAAYEDSQWAEALGFFDKAIAADPKYAPAYHYRGMCLLERKQPDEAVKALERARDLNQDEPDIFLDLGTAYQKAGRTDDALAAYREAVRRSPDSAAAQFSLGYLLVASKKYDDAFVPLAKARVLDPKLAPVARFYEGSALFGLKRLDEAKKAFNETLAMNPPADVAAACRKYLDVIEHGAKPQKRWELAAAMLYQYDSNLIIANDLTQFPVSFDGQEITHREDSRGVLTLFSRWMFLDRGPWSGEARYAFYQSFHAKTSSFNLQNHAPALTGTYSFKIFGREAAAVLDYQGGFAFLGPKVFWYSTDHFVTPSLQFKLSKNLMFAGSYRYINETFEAKDPNHDNTTHTGFMDAYWIFMGGKGLLRGSVGWDSSWAIDPDYTYSRPWVSVVANYSLPWKFKAQLSLGYLNENHFHTTSPHRIDDIFTSELLVFRPIWGPLEANLNVSYRLNNSTDEIFEYDRTIVGAGLIARF